MNSVKYWYTWILLYILECTAISLIGIFYGAHDLTVALLVAILVNKQLKGLAEDLHLVDFKGKNKCCVPVRKCEDK